MKKPVVQYFEAGVYYCRNRYPNLEYVPRGWQQVEYQCKVGDGEWEDASPILVSPETVCNVQSLFDYWSNSTYKYRLKPPQGESNPY